MTPPEADVDEVLRKTLERLSEDTRQLLDWEAQRLARLRREAGIIELWDEPLCSGHDHDEDER